MNADDDDTFVGPTDPIDPARPDPSKPGLAAATLSALRAGVRSEPAPEVGSEPASEVASEPALEVVAEPAPAIDANDVDEADPETAADHEAAVTADADTDDTTGTVRSRSTVLTVVCTVVAVAALVFACVAGVLWWRADHGTARKIGVAREQIVDDARLAIVTVNTSDYQHPSDALANWLEVSTGPMHAQFSQSRTTVVKLLAQARMVTKATVLDAAVTALNLRKGTASVIASVNVTRTPATGAVSTVRNRFRAAMIRIGGEWKLANLAVVPVSLS